MEQKEQAQVLRVSVAIDGIFKNSWFDVCALSPCRGTVTVLLTNHQTLVPDQCARYLNKDVIEKWDGAERFFWYHSQVLTVKLKNKSSKVLQTQLNCLVETRL